MSTRRPRSPSRPRRVPAAKTARGHWTTTGLAAGGGDLHEAALIIAKDAFNRASTWSASVPASVRVEGDDTTQTISFEAPPAYPAEVRARHPLFGDREHWYGPPGPPFLRPAVDARADDATARYAQVIDKIARENGWTDR